MLQKPDIWAHQGQCSCNDIITHSHACTPSRWWCSSSSQGTWCSCLGGRRGWWMESSSHSARPVSSAWSELHQTNMAVKKREQRDSEVPAETERVCVQGLPMSCSVGLNTENCLGKTYLSTPNVSELWSVTLNLCWPSTTRIWDSNGLEDKTRRAFLTADHLWISPVLQHRTTVAIQSNLIRSENTDVATEDQSNRL